MVDPLLKKLLAWLPVLSLLLVGLLLPVRGQEKTDEKDHWSYSGKNGPENWHTLNPNWAIAKLGKRQSPINLSKAKQVNFKAPLVSYEETPLAILNNGHTLEVPYAVPGVLIAEGKTYKLKQFHFHTPSEHQIEGKGYPMEVHLVHQRPLETKTELLVLGVLLKPGKANPLIQKILDNAPKKEGPAKMTGERINPKDLLPQGKFQLFRYDGSLTTPPCSENVRWYVYSTPVEVSVPQIKAFQEIFPVNARPVQPPFDRPVEVSGLLGG